MLDTCPLGRYATYMNTQANTDEPRSHGMLYNVENSQGRINAALRNWNGEAQRFEFEPVVGAVIVTDQGGTYQIRDESAWVEGAWRAESDNLDITLDGIVVRVTGRTIQDYQRPLPPHKQCGLGVRVEITFTGDGEADTVTRGWMKV